MEQSVYIFPSNQCSIEPVRSSHQPSEFDADYDSKSRIDRTNSFRSYFFVFGLNGFFNFIPMPPPPEPALKFLVALIGTGYLFPLIKGIEVLCGLALLSGLFVPLTLVVLAPIVVNIFLFHTILAHVGAPLAS